MSEHALDPVFGPFEEAPRKPRRDDRFVARVTGYDARGRPAGRVGEYAVEWQRWVGAPGSGAVPGALLEGDVMRRRKSTLHARIATVLEPSPDAVAPACEHFGSCGGCTSQDFAYEAQLRELERRLADLYAELPLPEPARVAPSPKVFGYRNKMDFSFASQRWTEEGEADPERPLDFALGLHVRGVFQKVLDVRSCAIHFEGADELLASVRERTHATGLAAWDVHDHTGFWRHAVLRRGVASGETLLFLVTAPVVDDAQRAALERVTRELVERHPDLTTIVHGETASLAKSANSDHVTTLHGPGQIVDALRGARFRISAESFFQTNTRAAEGMLEWIAERLGDERGGTLHDLYCGAGAIGLALSDVFANVVGIERVEAAVEDARRNAAENGIANASFHAGDVPELLAGELSGLPTPDVAVLDPPRAGLHRNLLEQLAANPPRRLVYVSCNPVAAASNLASLCESAYEIRAVRAFDLFPHTPHVETVFDLERRA